MDDDEKAKVLHKFHVVELYTTSFIAWGASAAVAIFFVVAILSHEKKYFWAAIPCALLFWCAGTYETDLRKQLNDPLADHEKLAEVIQRMKEENGA